MKQLAKGKNEEVILKLLKNLVGSTQGVRYPFTHLYQNYHETFLDDEGIRDVADVIKTEKPLFAEGEDPSMLECGDNQTETQVYKRAGKRSEAFAKYEQSVLAEMSRRGPASMSKQ